MAKKPISIKIDKDIDAQIRTAATRHGLSYTAIIERGAGKLARLLLKQDPLMGDENETKNP